MGVNNGFKLKEREYACVGFLTESGEIIELNLFNIGTPDYCHFPVDQILNRAKQIKSKFLLPIHNHPKDESVSIGDIKLTKYFSEIASGHDIKIVDHLILKSNGYFLLKKMGYFY